MPEIAFTKMHGLGNDFILINNLEYGLDASFFAAKAELLCERHFGIGADGLVLIESGKHTLFAMRVFNPDGSEAEMCGNAIRCIARYLWDRGLATEPLFSLETGAGLKEVSLMLQGENLSGVKVDMGAPVLESTAIPVIGPARRVINEPIQLDDAELLITAVSMGNPHCVIFLPEIAQIPWQRWGRQLEKNPFFPKRTNVEFARILNRQEVEVKVWERGAGPTLACGTGASAVVVAGVLAGRLDTPVQVHLPGGTLRISWSEGGPVCMEGPAEEVFTGCFIL